MLGLILVIAAGILALIDAVLRPRPDASYPGRYGWLLNAAVIIVCIALVIGVKTISLQ
jgi:hypothetical protein